jgi:hypothetical protein
MPVVQREEPQFRCLACGGRMIVCVDIEKERKLDGLNEAEVTYFRCEQCVHAQIVEK